MFTESFWLINWLNKEKVKDKKKSAVDSNSL